MPTHPEIFATSQQKIAEDTLKTLASDLSEALGADRLEHYEDKACIILEPKSDYDVLPETLPRTESILHVRLCTPYYDKGYERGYWPEIAATLEFLRNRLPEARVWYGPEGTEHVDEVTSEFLQRLWSYWSQYGGRPYYQRHTGGKQ